MFDCCLHFPNMLKSASRQADSSSHLESSHLILLVSKAVLELACLSLPGYTLARKGMFDAEMQKSVANLTLVLFTPCLSTPSTTNWSSLKRTYTYSIRQRCIPDDI